MASSKKIKAGETTRILRRIAHNMPQRFSFAVKTLNGGDVKGVIKVQGSSGPFPKAAITQPLQAENEVSKGAWDVFYSVYVTPEQDVELTLDAAEGGRLFIILIAALLILGIASSVLMRLLN